MKMHKSLTTERIIDAVERETFGLDNPGFCVECGEENNGCEPDARNYLCEYCGAQRVYGAEELLMNLC